MVQNRIKLIILFDKERVCRLPIGIRNKHSLFIGIISLQFFTYRWRIDIMMTIEKAYEKLYKLLEQIDNSDIPPSNKYELYKDIGSEIEQKKQQAYADMHEY